MVIWRIFMPRYVDRKISRFQNELVDRHYNEVETMYRKMRGWRHDYHNHIQVLKAHMSLSQYEQAEDYLDRLEEDLTSVDTVLKTGNVMVDAILNSKLTMIQEKKIAVDATAIVPEEISISGIDLSVLIGNLLDNAMEACMELDEEKERFIRIYIDIIKKQLYISVTNSMAGKAKRTGSGFLSRKTGSHGFGLLRIDSIVDKYGGFLNRQTEDGVFATEVTLPLTG
ncbi:MAG: GHKL domain-containing protein [Lachnospiraceae bacterium]|nr:GHKL domain-containing protein [Lachnospiraceae bacterium]